MTKSGLSPGLDGCKLGGSSSSRSPGVTNHNMADGASRPLLQPPVGGSSNSSTTSSSNSSCSETTKQTDSNKRTCLTPAGTHKSWELTNTSSLYISFNYLLLYLSIYWLLGRLHLLYLHLKILSNLKQYVKGTCHPLGTRCDVWWIGESP